MAYIWHFSVNFGFINEEGDSRELARQFCATFDGSPIMLGEKEVTFHLDSEKNDSGCEAYAVPWVGKELLNGYGGPDGEEEIKELDQVASILFDRLRSMKGYRYALVGTEVGDWRTPGGVIEYLKGLDHDEKPPQGLIVEQYIYDQAGAPKSFQPFVEGYWQVPWRTSGEY